MSRRVTTFGLVGLALIGLACGPFDERPSPPPEPESSVSCCEHYDREQFAALVGTRVVETAHDEIDLPDDGYRVRVEAMAVGRGVRPGPAKSAGLGRDIPMPKEPDAKHEVLSVLLSVTAVEPKRQESHGYVSWHAGATVVSVDDPDLDSTGVVLTNREGQEQKPTGTSTVVAMLVVPKGSTVVMCADFETDGRAWLNLRTGRYEPQPPFHRYCGHHGAQAWERLSPSPATTR